MNATKLTTALTALSILVAAAFSGTAQAGDASANLSISATVVSNCVISTTDLTFGEYDPIVANAADALTGNGSLTVTCTANTEVCIGLGQGEYDNGGSIEMPIRRMSDGAGNFLGYSLFRNAERSSQWGGEGESMVTVAGDGEAQLFTVYGSINPGQNVPSGDYSDTVLATVMF
jgi:spore coat protein U-like protein